MRKLIEVKAEHIKNGIRNSFSSCPIALALREYGYPASVDSFTAKIDGYHYYLPTRATRFIAKFDDYKPVKSFKFWFKEDQ